MNVAIIGTGYVASHYANTLTDHSELRLVGAFDCNPSNLARFCNRWPVKRYEALDEILLDPSVEMVVNLTNPRSHFGINRLSLEASKHVYSEKPLAMVPSDASKLVDLARQHGVRLAAAPCSLLSPTCQTLWKAIEDGLVGRIRLVYANFDDGLIAPNSAPWNWTNSLGVPWPAKDEFEIGCTYEHAGYVLTWLAAFFGPARRVSSFSSCQVPDKGIPVDSMAPDFSVGCIEYAENVVARVTCGLVAPRDKSITIVGDRGTIFTANVRNDESPVYYRRYPTEGVLGAVERRVDWIRRTCERFLPSVPWNGHEWKFQRKCPPAIKNTRGFFVDKRDFSNGLAELASAIRENRPCRLSAELALHIVELTEALQHPERFGGSRTISSTFDPILRLEWNS